jgi:hypothetical protein
MTLQLLKPPKRQSPLGLFWIMSCVIAAALVFGFVVGWVGKVVWHVLTGT